MLISEEEVEQIKLGNHKVYLWRPKPKMWLVKKGLSEQE